MTVEMYPGDAAQAQADAEDREAREDFPTPRALVRAALAAMVEVEDPATLDSAVYHGEPVRVLDVCAGSGVWASEMRRLSGRQGWPVHITGIELSEDRGPALKRWCDDVYIGDWESVGLRCGRMNAVGHRDEDWLDIAIGNPHFTALAAEDEEQSMPAVLLRHAPAVLVLHTQQAFIRGRAGRRVLRAYPRAHVWDVPGAVSFTADGKADARCYQVSLWLRGHSGTTGQSLLPEPPNGAGSWRYSIPPGTEEPSEDLPAAPGWSPC